MPTHPHSGVAVRLAVTSLSRSTTKSSDILKYGRGNQKEDAERIDRELSVARPLEEQVFPEGDSDMLVRFLGDQQVPFYLAHVTPPQNALCDPTAETSLTSSSGANVSGGSVLETPDSAASSDSNHTQGYHGTFITHLPTLPEVSEHETPIPNRHKHARQNSATVSATPEHINVDQKALVLNVRLLPETFSQGHGSALFDIKIEVFYNGEYAGLSYCNGRSYQKSMRRLKLEHVFSGSRVHRQLERPWILSTNQTAMSPKDMYARSLQWESRWREISDAIAQEAAYRGSDENGKASPVATYLQCLANIPCPSMNEDDIFSDTGRSMGIVDIVVSMGAGFKDGADAGYIFRPARMADSRCATSRPASNAADLQLAPSTSDHVLLHNTHPSQKRSGREEAKDIRAPSHMVRSQRFCDNLEQPSERQFETLTAAQIALRAGLPTNGRLMQRLLASHIGLSRTTIPTRAWHELPETHDTLEQKVPVRKNIRQVKEASAKSGTFDGTEKRCRGRPRKPVSYQSRPDELALDPLLSKQSRSLKKGGARTIAKSSGQLGFHDNGPGEEDELAGYEPPTKLTGNLQHSKSAEAERYTERSHLLGGMHLPGSNQDEYPEADPLSYDADKATSATLDRPSMDSPSRVERNFTTQFHSNPPIQSSNDPPSHESSSWANRAPVVPAMSSTPWKKAFPSRNISNAEHYKIMQGDFQSKKQALPEAKSALTFSQLDSLLVDLTNLPKEPMGFFGETARSILRGSKRKGLVTPSKSRAHSSSSRPAPLHGHPQPKPLSFASPTPNSQRRAQRTKANASSPFDLVQDYMDYDSEDFPLKITDLYKTQASRATIAKNPRRYGIATAKLKNRTRPIPSSSPKHKTTPGFNQDHLFSQGSSDLFQTQISEEGPLITPTRLGRGISPETPEATIGSSSLSTAPPSPEVSLAAMKPAKDLSSSPLSSLPPTPALMKEHEMSMVTSPPIPLSDSKSSAQVKGWQTRRAKACLSENGNATKNYSNALSGHENHHNGNASAMFQINSGENSLTGQGQETCVPATGAIPKTLKENWQSRKGDSTSSTLTDPTSSPSVAPPPSTPRQSSTAIKPASSSKFNGRERNRAAIVMPPTPEKGGPSIRPITPNVAHGTLMKNWKRYGLDRPPELKPLNSSPVRKKQKLNTERHSTNSVLAEQVSTPMGVDGHDAGFGQREEAFDGAEEEEEHVQNVQRAPSPSAILLESTTSQLAAAATDKLSTPTIQESASSSNIRQTEDGTGAAGKSAHESSTTVHSRRTRQPSDDSPAVTRLSSRRNVVSTPPVRSSRNPRLTTPQAGLPSQPIPSDPVIEFPTPHHEATNEQSHVHPTPLTEHANPQKDANPDVQFTASVSKQTLATIAQASSRPMPALSADSICTYAMPDLYAHHNVTPTTTSAASGSAGSRPGDIIPNTLRQVRKERPGTFDEEKVIVGFKYLVG